MKAEASARSLTTAPQERPAQKAEQIYGILRHAIVRLAMEPGAAISEKELCLEHGVSRTPVREALKRLADEDLVEVFPHSGTYVSKISYEVAEEGFVIRRALEIESVRRAAQHATPADIARLDGLIAEISRFPRMWKFITLVKAHLDRMRQLSAPVPGHLAEVTEQHDAVVRALERQSADQAELAMRIHLEGSFAVMSSLYREGVFFRPRDPRFER